MSEYLMPERTRESIDRYVERHVPTGDFLKAVLANDLKDAVGRADDENILCLRAIVQYLYNECPATCWGSREKVAAWIEKGRVAALKREHV